MCGSKLYWEQPGVQQNVQVQIKVARTAAVVTLLATKSLVTKLERYAELTKVKTTKGRRRG